MARWISNKISQQRTQRVHRVIFDSVKNITAVGDESQTGEIFKQFPNGGDNKRAEKSGQENFSAVLKFIEKKPRGNTGGEKAAKKMHGNIKPPPIKEQAISDSGGVKNCQQGKRKKRNGEENRAKKKRPKKRQGIKNPQPKKKQAISDSGGVKNCQQ